MFFNRGRPYNPDEVPGPEAVLRSDGHWSTHGLVGYWPMLEGTGGVVRDYAWGRHGEFINGPTWTVGAHAQYAILPSTTGPAYVGNIGAVRPYVPFSVVLTVPTRWHGITQCVAGENTRSYVDSGWRIENTQDNQYWLFYLGDNVGALSAGRRGVQCDYNQADNVESRYVMLFRDWDTGEIWRDGRQLATSMVGDSTAGQIAYRAKDEMKIGAHDSGGSYWPISNVGVYDRALSANEIAELHAHPYLPLWRPASVSVWDMGAGGAVRRAWANPGIGPHIGPWLTL